MHISQNIRLFPLTPELFFNTNQNGKVSSGLFSHLLYSLSTYFLISFFILFYCIYLSAFVSKESYLISVCISVVVIVVVNNSLDMQAVYPSSFYTSFILL